VSEPDVSVCAVVVAVPDVEDVVSHHDGGSAGSGAPVVGSPVGPVPAGWPTPEGVPVSAGAPVPVPQPWPVIADWRAHWAVLNEPVTPSPSTPAIAPVITTSIRAYSTLMAPRERL